MSLVLQATSDRTDNWFYYLGSLDPLFQTEKDFKKLHILGLQSGCGHTASWMVCVGWDGCPSGSTPKWNGKINVAAELAF
jgi:hypothetical protein